MDIEDTSFEGCLARSLDELTVSNQSSPGRSLLAREWHLPEDDRDALVRWGIPTFDDDGSRPPVQLVGEVQESVTPEINERDVVAYRLGTYWGRKIGALTGSGTIVGVPQDASRNVSKINSAVRFFVEIAWRWKCAREILLITDDYEKLYSRLGRFQQFVHGLDPVVRENPEYDWWNGIVEGW
jgi:hypothetical protein